MKLILKLFNFFIVFLLIIGCTQKIDTKNAVALVGKGALTSHDITVAKKTRRITPKNDSKERTIKVFSDILKERLYALSAKDTGLTDDPYHKKRIQSIKKRILLNLYIEKNITQNAGFNDADLKAHFESKKSEFLSDSTKNSFDDVLNEVVKSYLIQTQGVDSFFLANKQRYWSIRDGDTTVPSLDSIKDRVANDFIRGHKSDLQKNLKEILFAKYGVEKIEPKADLSDENLKEFYESNKDRYVTAEQYEVYHLETATKEESEKLSKGITDLETFKASASKNTTNKWIKDKAGYVGFIKKSKSLPYEIGMLPAVFAQLDSLAASDKKQGLTTPLDNPFTKKWHVFWVTAKKEKESKPFERVKTVVKQNFIQERGVKVSEDEIIAKYNKTGQILEKDVVVLRKEIPPSQQQSYTRAALRDYLLMWELGTLEAENSGMMKDSKVKARLGLDMDYQWSRIYQDSIVKNSFGLSNDELKAVYDENTAYFVTDTTKPYSEMLNRNIAIFQTIPKSEFEIEYHSNPDKYKKDSDILSYADSRYRLFNNLRNKYLKKPEENLLEKLKAKYNVSIKDSSLVPAKLDDSKEAFETARSLHLDRKLYKAIEQFDLIRTSFPDNQGLQDSVCMSKAQVLIELERFNEALTEYRRLLYLYPKSENNYKAQFMIGFILAENLKREPEAVVAFKSLLGKYPQCDLADDADWMIRNIESGGALMPKLEDS